MKKWAFALLALAVLLSAAGQAEEALFDMVCPDGWTYDDKCYDDSSTPDSVWVCQYSRGEEITVNVYRDYVPEWAGVTIMRDDTENAAAYKQELDSLYSVKAMSLPNVTASGGNVFFPYAVADEYGLYVVAMTLVNGWEVSVSMETQQTVQPEDLSTLTDMVATFTLRGDPEDWTVPAVMPEGSYSL